jgi:hypothetical protein
MVAPLRLCLALCLCAPLCALGQCAFNNDFITDATPPVCPGSFSSFCVWGGEYLSVSVVQGNEYTFSTCNSFAFDSQLTLYDASGSAVLDYNDDFCGLQSQIEWTATYTGVVNILLDAFPCIDLPLCMQLDVNCTPSGASGNGCNTDVILCQNSAGPFAFGTPGPAVSTCLDWFSTSQFAYILLNITTTGPLNLLIDGNSNLGFLDVAVFNIPDGIPACQAIQSTANQLGCNYADFSSGCNQFGTTFPCPSSVPSPIVSAGQTIMIVVEDWQNGPSSTFNLQLGPPPNAQSGPANPAIAQVGPFCATATPVQLNVSDAGGLWTGPGTSTTGLFTPSAAGVGVHLIQYSIGQPPCQATSSTTIQVVSQPTAAAVVADPWLCPGEQAAIAFTGTPGAQVQFTINRGSTQAVTLNSIGQATFTTSGLLAATVVDIVSVTLPGPPPCTVLSTQSNLNITVGAIPATTPIIND